MSRKKYAITCTAFDRKGNVVSTGTNDYHKTNPLAKHFSILAGESEAKDRVHAELAAMLAARGRKVHTVFVSRVDAMGTPALAKPCKACQKMLKAFGVVVARYSSADGVMVDLVKDY